MEELERINREITQLEDLLQPGNLYQPAQALYHQPSDLECIRVQEAHHKDFAPKLKEVLQRRLAGQAKEETGLKQSYRKQYETWSKEIQKIERINDENHEETFGPAKQAQLLPTQPQANLNTTNVNVRSRSRSGLSFGGDVVRSEEELNQVLLNLLEQERNNPATRWMSTLAIIPPMTSDKSQFISENTRIHDVSAGFHERQFPCLPTDSYMTEDGRAWSQIWTAEEEKIFIDRYLQYPKLFSRIAAFLPAKSTSDCVQFYYRNKKRLRLKQRLQQHRRGETSYGGIVEVATVVKKKVGRPPRTQQILTTAPTADEDLEISD